MSRELTSLIIDEQEALSLAEICRCCALPAETVLKMIEHGIIEPYETQVTVSRWRFNGQSVVRVKIVQRLQRDLGVNMAGAALALELLDEVKTLRQQVAAFRQQQNGSD